MQQNFLKNQAKLEQDFKDFLEKEILTKCPQVAIETKISVDDFKEKYVLKNRPVILKGVVEKWPAIAQWDFDHFSKKCGDLEVNVNLYDVKNTKKSTIKSLVQEIKQAKAESPVYLQEWWFQTDVPDLLNDIIVPQYFLDDQNLKLLGFYNSTLWVGSKGAKTPVHQDTLFANIWTAQIRGKKEWILFDKNADLKTKKDGTADYEEFISNPANGVMYCILEQGDVFYVPHKWWHRASTLENSISLNTFYITDEIVRRYIRDVMSIPMAVSLNKDLLIENDLMRYNICMQRINILSELLGYDKKNVLGIKL